MRELLGELEGALNAELYTLALVGALAIPDIAGALESNNGEATRARYEAWFDANVPPHLQAMQGGAQVGTPRPLNGANCYRFRCSLLHQGAIEDQKPDPTTYRRLIFVDPSGVTPWATVFGRPVKGWFVYTKEVRLGNGDLALAIDLPLFCRAIVAAARGWLERVSGIEPFETNLAKCVRRRPEGFPGWLTGMPVIA